MQDIHCKSQACIKATVRKGLLRWILHKEIGTRKERGTETKTEQAKECEGSAAVKDDDDDIEEHDN